MQSFQNGQISTHLIISVNGSQTLVCIHARSESMHVRQNVKCACSCESEDNVHYSAGDLLFKYFPGPQTIQAQRAESAGQHIYIRPTVMDSDAF